MGVGNGVGVGQCEHTITLAMQKNILLSDIIFPNWPKIPGLFSHLPVRFYNCLNFLDWNNFSNFSSASGNTAYSNMPNKGNESRSQPTKDEKTARCDGIKVTELLTLQSTTLLIRNLLGIAGCSLQSNLGPMWHVYKIILGPAYEFGYYEHPAVTNTFFSEGSGGSA